MVRDDPATGVLELEAVTRHADRFDGTVDVELGEDVHAVRRHAEEQPFAEASLRPPFADDRLDANPLKKHAEHWPGDATPDDHGPFDTSLPAMVQSS